MAGYYDEVTGAWIDTGDTGVTAGPLDNTSGTGTMSGWDYLGNNVWTDPSGATFDLSYLSNSQTPLDTSNLSGGLNLTGLMSGLKGLVATNGQLDLTKALPLIAGLAAASQSNNRTVPAGYQGGIPKYVATRNAPAAGQRVSGDVTYTRAAAAGGELQEGGFVIPADVVSHFGNGSSDAGLKALSSHIGATPIRGAGDGMSDSIPAKIDGQDDALVAHEEAYMSPEKVARLGGGSPERGADKLRNMMARIREARTGTPEQGRQIDPRKFMPGGEVKRYAAGDTTTMTPTAAASAGITGTESSLSNWVGPYVTNMLGQGQALANMPYQAYTGPLAAGPSALQTQAFDMAGNLQPNGAGIAGAAQTAGDIGSQMQNLSYNPTDFTTGTFDTTAAQQYMNPYLEMSLAPQLAELQRQNQIADMADMSKLTKAGAYGGSRQAVMQAENTRNLMDKVNQVTGQGYNTAYDKAMAQFNADQARKLQEQQYEEQSKQYGANYGLQGLQGALSAAQTQGGLGSLANQTDLANLSAVTGLGATQRGITAEQIAADKAAFDAAVANPYKMVQFQQSLLSGLPLAAQTYNVAPTNNLSQFAGGLTTLQNALKSLNLA